MQKKIKLPFEGLEIGTKSEEISNPVSGEKVMLSPEAVAVYDTIKGAEMLGDYSTMEKGIVWFREHFAKEYMILLD